MNKLGIITIYNSNYGNRLQNYALQEVLRNNGYEVETIKNCMLLNIYKGRFNYFLRRVKSILGKNDFYDGYSREKYFKKFNKNIKFNKKYFTWNAMKKFNNYDCLIVGSDQVWNPKNGRLTNFDLATFGTKKKISYAASIGLSSLSDDSLKKLKNGLKDFDAVSIREEEGKKILQSIEIKADVHIDPTMLLSSSEWDKISVKPEFYNGNKYILLYYLGELSTARRKEIERIAKEKNYEIINILDKNSIYYNCGPSEFLWLEKHAELICTDSFHSSVFAIIYNRPFIIFEREQSGMGKMNSRIDTLIDKFKLKNRIFNCNITRENLDADYSEAYKILEKEKKKSLDYLLSNLK